jgi:hypothetical protein
MEYATVDRSSYSSVWQIHSLVTFERVVPRPLLSLAQIAEDGAVGVHCAHDKELIREGVVVGTCDRDPGPQERYLGPRNISHSDLHYP